MVFRSIATAGLITALLAGLIFMKPTNAQTVITDELITKIQNNCVENLASLRRLHQTDAFLRNDRGELYRTISNKLMVPLNQRLVAHELDAGELITTTADYNKVYSAFYGDYVKYDNSMNRLLDIDCSKEPVTFYTGLLDARDKRSTLNKSDQTLVLYIKQYKAQFDNLRAEFESESL